MTETEMRILLNQRLCQLADVLILYYDPCQMADGACRASRLLGGPCAPCCRSRHYEEFNPEGRCPFLGEQGCTVAYAKCKLWFCESVLRAMDPKCLEAFRDLERLLKLFDLGSRPYLGEGYVGRAAEVAALRGRGG